MLTLFNSTDGFSERAVIFFNPEAIIVLRSHPILRLIWRQSFIGVGGLAAWYIIAWMCVFQQVWLFQVMYITATSPYLFMLALLIRNCLLPGARTGILFYLTPDWSRLNDLEVNFYIESCKLDTKEDFLSFSRFN